MSHGYDGKLYILAFDHRGSFQTKMFGIEGDPTPEQTATIADAKHLIFEGMAKAAERGADPAASGTLVDEQFGGDTDRYDAELRPALMRGAIEAIQDFGIDVDIWKIEGVDERSDCEMLAEVSRRDGRDGVVCVLLGRGASDAKVDHWLRQAAPDAGFVGFAIGRSIWWDALKGFLDGSISREDASDQVAANYLRFVEVYEGAEQSAHV